MKKSGIVFLLLCFFLLGMIAGRPTQETASNDLRERLDEFEEEIVIPAMIMNPFLRGRWIQIFRTARAAGRKHHHRYI